MSALGDTVKSMGTARIGAMAAAAVVMFAIFMVLALSAYVRIGREAVLGAGVVLTARSAFRERVERR